MNNAAINIHGKLLSGYAVIQSCLTLWPCGLYPARLLYWNGLTFSTLEIFPIQGSNLCLLYLLHWQVDSLPLHHSFTASLTFKYIINMLFILLITWKFYWMNKIMFTHSIFLFLDIYFCKLKWFYWLFSKDVKNKNYSASFPTEIKWPLDGNQIKLSFSRAPCLKPQIQLEAINITDFSNQLNFPQN